MKTNILPGGLPSVDGQTVLLRRLLVASWSSLPALLGGSVLCCLAFTLVLLCGPGPTPAGAVLMGVLVIPAFTRLIRTYHGSLFGCPVRGRAASSRSLGLCWSGFWVPTLRIALVPVAAGGLALTAWQMWVQTGQWWAWGPLAVCVAVTVVSTVAALLALTLRESDPGLTTSQLWAMALTMIAHQPIPAASTLVLPATGLWACVHLTASMALLVPLPTAFVVVAAVWTSGEGQRLLDAIDRGSEDPTTFAGRQL